MPPRRKKTIGPKYAETVHWGPRPGDDTRGGRWVLEDDSYIVPDPPPPPPEPTMPELLERAGARVGGGADDDGEVEVARFHLRRVCELHVHGTHTVGESNDISHLPATIRLTRAVEDEVNDDAQPPTHAALYITSEMEVARWRIADPANAVARSGDALIVTVEGVDHVSTNVDWMPSPARAFVLRFMYDDDLETCRAALASPSAETVPKPPKRARPDGSRKQNPDATALFNTNAFDAKTDSASAVEYFRYYGLIPQQQNMLQDAVRTGTYFTAILENARDFKDKVVMDVGAGSGILSFFAAMAGARRVYAVEASAMSEHCAKLLEGNPRLRDVIVIVNGKVEEVDIPEKVDVMVSEPMGTLLYNERMIESYLLARDRFMRREDTAGGDTAGEGGSSSDFGSGGAGLSLRGKMFPGGGRVHCAPFADETLWREIKDKAHFWGTEDFYGVDLTPLREEAVRSYFRQCVVDAFETELLLSQPVSFAWDWTTLRADELESLDMHLEFKVQRAGPVHGVACWFDVLFEGTAKSRWLTTAPGLPTTHWYQMRLVFERPMRCEAGETVKGRMKMTALDNQSYAVTVELKGKGGKAVSGEWDLKDPYYRQTIYPQPGYTKEQLARFYGEPPA